jgi:hypothetical protein
MNHQGTKTQRESSLNITTKAQRHKENQIVVTRAQLSKLRLMVFCSFSISVNSWCLSGE